MLPDHRRLFRFKLSSESNTWWLSCLDLLLHEHTIDPTLNDPLTSTLSREGQRDCRVDSPFGLLLQSILLKTARAVTLLSQIQWYLLRTTEEVLHCTTTIKTTPLNMLATSQGVYMAVCLTNLFRKTRCRNIKTTFDSIRAEGDPGYYTALKQQSHLSTCAPPPSTRVTRSRVIRSLPSLSTQVAA